MSLKSIYIFSIDLPVSRPFQWRVLLLLVLLYFLGNLAGVPLLLKTTASIEPVWFWGVVTLISALVIALSMVMANRVGLGAPFLESRLLKEDLPRWFRSGLALTLLMFVVGSPFSLIANLKADPATYPFGWELLPTSLSTVLPEVGIIDNKKRFMTLVFQPVSVLIRTAY